MAKHLEFTASQSEEPEEEKNDTAEQLETAKHVEESSEAEEVDDEESDAHESAETANEGKFRILFYVFFSLLDEDGDPDDSLIDRSAVEAEEEELTEVSEEESEPEPDENVDPNQTNCSVESSCLAGSHMPNVFNVKTPQKKVNSPAAESEDTDEECSINAIKLKGKFF